MTHHKAQVAALLVLPCATSAQVRITALSSDTGALAYETERTFREPTELWVVETTAGRTTVPRSLGIALAPAWSPNSKQLAFLALSDGVLQLFVWDRATGGRRQLTRVSGGIRPSFYASTTPNRRESMRLSWSPDGSTIAFAALAEEATQHSVDSVAIVLDQHSPAPAVWAAYCATRSAAGSSKVAAPA